MRVVIDIEANSLKNPTQIWLIVCKDIDTGKYYIFRNVTSNEEDRLKFIEFSKMVSLWIGHNWLGYDLPVLHDLLGSAWGIDYEQIVNVSADTLVASKLANYSRDGHSIESYGLEFGVEKIHFNDFKQWSQEMETYCIRDVDICHKVFLKYLSVVSDRSWASAFNREQRFQLLVNELEDNGFYFDKAKAEKLHAKVVDALKIIDVEMQEAFPPREVLIREFVPKATLHGTISKTSIPRSLWGNVADYEVGQTYRHTKRVDFNPSSHKQIVQVLAESGWQPTDKTQSHIDAERERNRLRYSRQARSAVDTKTYDDIIIRLEQFQKTGWKVNENNLSTLPDTAPAPARLLAKRILLESRRRTLTEWMGLVEPSDLRIHGKFYGIGAWTHRMAHQQPNTANIPSEFREDGSTKLLGKEMRQLWRAPRNRLLVGVDAEGIQLRIFAHYINDPEFTNALVYGRKEDQTDPHNLNKKILGDLCRTRQAAKRFIFAFLLGGGVSKLSQILECSESEGKEALDRLLDRYEGLARLKKTTIPKDAERGYFIGLDGRRVLLPGDTVGERKHLCMSGYLQNGEKIVVAETTLKTVDKLLQEDVDFLLVDIVHDEVLFEVRNDIDLAKHVGKVFCEKIAETGVEFGLRCALAGDAKYGLTWYDVH